MCRRRVLLLEGMVMELPGRDVYRTLLLMGARKHSPAIVIRTICLYLRWPELVKDKGKSMMRRWLVLICAPMRNLLRHQTAVFLLSPTPHQRMWETHKADAYLPPAFSSERCQEQSQKPMWILERENGKGCVDSYTWEVQGVPSCGITASSWLCCLLGGQTFTGSMFPSSTIMCFLLSPVLIPIPVTVSRSHKMKNLSVAAEKFGGLQITSLVWVTCLWTGKEYSNLWSQWWDPLLATERWSSPRRTTQSEPGRPDFSDRKQCATITRKVDGLLS